MKIPTYQIVLRSPCKKCLIRACCTISCEKKEIWNERFLIFTAPIYGIIIVFIIPTILILNILGVSIDAPEEDHYFY